MSIKRFLAMLMLVAYLPACAHYQPTTQPLPELTAPPKPVKQIRVTLTNGSRVQVTSPHMESDTLRGTEGYARTSGPPVAIPLAEVTAVEVVPPSSMSGGTKMLVAAVAVGLGVLVISWGKKLGDCGWMCE
jgi:hypothetical protein